MIDRQRVGRPPQSEIPSWVFAPRMAVATGLVIALVGVLILQLTAFVGSALQGPATVPACFLLQGAKPLVAGSETFTGLGWIVQRAEGYKESYATKVLAAQQLCKPGACTTPASKAYRSALFWYLSERASQSQQFYMRFGDEGLTFIKSLYGHDDDRDIEERMQELHRAGLFSLHPELGQIERILLSKSGAALTPCAAKP